MLYINQNDYEHIEYLNDLDNGGAPKEKSNIKASGCGLCSMCMVVNNITDKNFPLEDCIEIVYQTGGNRVTGSRMRVYAPTVAKRFGLEYKKTNSINEAIKCLKKGGNVIVLVKGNREGKKGIFTSIGHYIVLNSYRSGEFCIFDPGYTKERYEQDFIKEKVDDTNFPFIYCKKEVIEEEADNSVYAYYLFSRKKN